MMIGHSFGSLVTSWMLRECPSMVAASALLDPVALFLHRIDTLFSFIYGARGLDIAGLLRSCLFISHALRRRFSWLVPSQRLVRPDLVARDLLSMSR
jgi:pimeloyl-ACP methyl ester carboxylesterase